MEWKGRLGHTGMDGGKGPGREKKMVIKKHLPVFKNNLFLKRNKPHWDDKYMFKESISYLCYTQQEKWPG